MNKKIGILLPFKDQFTKSKAGSASIWIKDFNKNSKYRKQILIFGHTNDLDDLISRENYINLSVKHLYSTNKIPRIWKIQYFEYQFFSDIHMQRK